MIDKHATERLWTVVTSDIRLCGWLKKNTINRKELEKQFNIITDNFQHQVYIIYIYLSESPKHSTTSMALIELKLDSLIRSAFKTEITSDRNYFI